jgi:hypothetical protein
MKGNEAIEVLKVIYCMGFNEFARALNVDLSDEFREEYWLNKFEALRKNMFVGLCDLDNEKQNLLWDYAKNKYNK